MISCKFCQSSNEDFYLFTICKHLVCTICAFQRADFSLQTIQCCERSTSIAEESMSTIIKSRRCKRSQINNFSPFNKSGITEEELALNDKSDIIPKSFVTKQRQSSQDNNEITKSRQSNNKQSRIMQQKLELETILFKQIQRIKQEFNAEHQKLQQRQKIMINQLLNTYEEESKLIFNNANNVRKVDEIIENRSIEQDQKGPMQDIQNKVEILSLKMSRYAINNEKEQNKTRKTTRQNVDTNNQMKENQLKNSNMNSNDGSIIKLSKWNEEWLSDTKKNKIQYDYILKRLQINQQRMNQKLQRHAHAY